MKFVYGLYTTIEGEEKELTVMNSDITHASVTYCLLALKVLVATIDTQWEGCRVGEVQAGTTSPMPDQKGFKLQ